MKDKEKINMTEFIDKLKDFNEEINFLNKKRNSDMNIDRIINIQKNSINNKTNGALNNINNTNNTITENKNNLKNKKNDNINDININKNNNSDDKINTTKIKREKRKSKNPRNKNNQIKFFTEEEAKNHDKVDTGQNNNKIKNENIIIK